MCPTLKEHPSTGSARGTQCCFVPCCYLCFAALPARLLIPWDRENPWRLHLTVAHSPRTYAHSRIKEESWSRSLLRLIWCWVILAVDSWWKLNSHFGGDDGLEQLVACFKNCVRKACKQSCIALYKFKKQRLHFKPDCNQKRRTGFPSVLCDRNRRWVL